MTWLSIDGGNEAKTGRACYVAYWRGDVLIGVEANTLAQVHNAPPVDCVVVERQQQDGRIAGGGGRVPPGVVIDLAWNTAAVAYTLARGAPVHEYTPAQWIGSTPKAALQTRIWRALSADERAVVAAFGRTRKGVGPVESVTAALLANNKRHATGKPPLKHDWYNVLDAVGVGLFHLGRVGKGGATVRGRGAHG